MNEPPQVLVRMAIKALRNARAAMANAAEFEHQNYNARTTTANAAESERQEAYVYILSLGYDVDEMDLLISKWESHADKLREENNR